MGNTLVEIDVFFGDAVSFIPVFVVVLVILHVDVVEKLLAQPFEFVLADIGRHFDHARPSSASLGSQPDADELRRRVRSRKFG
jgi:hypothetical protein